MDHHICHCCNICFILCMQVLFTLHDEDTLYPKRLSRVGDLLKHWFKVYAEGHAPLSATFMRKFWKSQAKRRVIEGDEDAILALGSAHSVAWWRHPSNPIVFVFYPCLPGSARFAAYSFPFAHYPPTAALACRPPPSVPRPAWTKRFSFAIKRFSVRIKQILLAQKGCPFDPPPQREGFSFKSSHLHPSALNPVSKNAPRS